MFDWLTEMLHLVSRCATRRVDPPHLVLSLVFLLAASSYEKVYQNSIAHIHNAWVFAQYGRPAPSWLTWKPQKAPQLYVAQELS